MSVRNLFVVGASAGGFNALRQLASELPADLDAAVLVVLHMAPDFPSNLHQFLSAVSELPAVQGNHGDAILPGRIYVAPPDCHMLVHDGTIALSHGPRENFSRPAIDPLFRSAAQTYGPRVTGVVLSGTLGDGTVGMMVVKAHGGTTVVQDPKESQFSQMSELAIANAPIDHVLSIGQISALLVERANGSASKNGTTASMETSLETSSDLVQQDLRAQVEGRRSGQTATYSCPECGGTLWQLDEQGMTQQFRCHVGHTYAPEALLGGMSNNLENALWSAVRALVERATLNRQMAKRHRDNGREKWAQSMEEQAAQDDRYMRMIRENILGLSSAVDAKPVTSSKTER
jgi:two-component system chemotaxis response regulator CheB